MEFQSVQHTVDKLVQWIRTGRLALPDFQRDFVWNPARVVELLDSVARQWPIGSLLLLSGPQPFGIRPIAHAPPLSGTHLDYYILDGQQRLTSLYHAVSDVSEFCYFVDFKALLSDQEDYIRWEKREVFEKKFMYPVNRAQSSIALIRDIWDLDAFYEWIESVNDPVLQRAYVALREKRLGGLQAKVYKLMAIELDQEIQVEALARIFETLNRTGVRLNAFDLMVAMLYPTGFHLRDKWEEAKLSYDLLDEYSVDPIELLKLVALLIRGAIGKQESRGVRQGDLLDLDRDLIPDFWDEAVELYSEALEYARSRLGVFCADVVPSWAMILAIASFLQKRPQDDLLIERWFWASVFAQTYSQAANTVVVSDFDAYLVGRLETVAEERYQDSFIVFEEPARKNGLALRGLACLIARYGGRDLVDGNLIRESGSVAFRVVSPNGTLSKLGGSDGFTRVVIMSRESDRRLSKTSPVPAFHGVSAEEISGRLKSQFISPTSHSRDLQELRDVIDVLGLGNQE